MGQEGPSVPWHMVHLNNNNDNDNDNDISVFPEEWRHSGAMIYEAYNRFIFCCTVRWKDKRYSETFLDNFFFFFLRAHGVSW